MPSLEKMRELKKVLPHEGGTRFYFKHLSPKAKLRKKRARQQTRLSRRQNR